MPCGMTATLDTPVDAPAPANEELSHQIYFPTSVYTIEKPEFLKNVKQVSNEYLNKQRGDKKIDDIYPVVMSGNLSDDPRMADFCRYVGMTSWNILNSQGYAMDNLSVFFTEMWCQEHHKHSLMEQHAHGGGIQLVGFYFLETPPDCSRVVFHDPRPAKVQINLPESDITQVTSGTSMVNFEPKPGLLMFTNAWLPHSFGRHASKKPIKFIHFNLAIKQNEVCNLPANPPANTAPPAEVI